MPDKHGSSDTWPAVEDWHRYKKLVLDKLDGAHDDLKLIARELRDTRSELSRIAGQVQEARSDIEDMGKIFDKLESRVSELEKRPEPGDPDLRRPALLGGGAGVVGAAIIEGIARLVGG